MHKEFEWLKTLSQDSSLVQEGLMMLLSLSSRSRNYFPLRSKAWNIIFQMFRMLSLLLFLLKSHEVLLGKSGVGLKTLVSLLTAL